MFRWTAWVLILLGSFDFALAQDVIPDLKGVWTGKGGAIVIGNDPFRPDHTTSSGTPHKADLDLTFTIKGQEGRLLWGELSSSATSFTKVFAWAIADDNRTILGADADGLYWLRIVSADRMERCYVQTAANAAKSIIASCFAVDRLKQ